MIVLSPQGFYQLPIFKEFPEVIHGISIKKSGDMLSTSSHIKNLATFLKKSHKKFQNLTNFAQKLGIQIGNFIIPEQTNSGKVEEVIPGHFRDTTNELFVQSADGLVVNKKGLFLLVTVADCYPILAYEPKSRVVGAAHAGWRGISSKIVKNLILKMKNLGAKPKNIVVGIGPGICVNHYEIKDDVAQKFDKKFFTRKNGKIFLDLEKAIISQLLSARIKKENIETASVCVFENEDFYSFRRDKTEERFAALIGMKR